MNSICLTDSLCTTVLCLAKLSRARFSLRSTASSLNKQQSQSRGEINGRIRQTMFFQFSITFGSFIYTRLKAYLMVENHNFFQHTLAVSRNLASCLARQHVWASDALENAFQASRHRVQVDSSQVFETQPLSKKFSEGRQRTFKHQHKALDTVCLIV